MRRIRWQFKAAGLAATLAAVFPCQEPLQAQVDGWVIGNQAVVMPPGTGSDAGDPFTLPQPNDPAIPAAFRYQGQVAARSQHVRTTGDERILFFAVDGKLYDGDGYLIADARGPGCTECLDPGIMEFVSVPVPGRCGMFYLFSAVPKEAAGFFGTHVQWSILDMNADNPRFPADAPTTCARKGRLLSLDEIGQAPYANFNGWAVEYENGTGVQPTSDHMGALPSTSASTSPRFRVVESANANGDHWLFSIIDNRVYVDRVTANGIFRVQPTPGQSSLLIASNANNGNQPYYYDADAILTTLPNRTDDVLALAIADGYRMFPFPATTNGVNNLLVHYFDRNTGALLQGDSKAFQVNAPPAGCNGVTVNLPAGGFIATSLRGCAFRSDGNGLYLTGERTTDCQTAEPYVVHLDLNSDVYTDLGYAFGSAIDPEWVRTRIYRNAAVNGSGAGVYFPALGQVGVLQGLENLSTCTFTAGALGTVAPPLLFNGLRPVDCGFVPRFLDIGVAHDRYLSATNRLNCCTFLQSRGSGMVYGHLQEAGEAIVDWTPLDNPYGDTSPLTCVCDVVIEENAQLNVSNMELRFAPGHGVQVYRKGMLEVFNTKLNNLEQCPENSWKGIEVQGIINQNQLGSPHPTHQGKLVLKGSTVQNAEIGVLVAKRGQWGNLAAGGVVLASRAWVTEDDGAGGTFSFWKPTTFRNCRESVHFPAFQNFLSSGITFGNLSRFNDCVFTVDDQYPVAYDFQHHVYMHRVDGIHFRACTFENALPDAFFDEAGDFPGSLYLGHGIRSLDAHYSVSSTCNTLLPQGATCPEANTRFSEFRGLDHGIHALGSAKLRNFSANRVKFTDNIAGVYSSAVVGYSVKNSIFSIGGRNVELTNQDELFWEDSHRGIFSHSSYAFTVEDNTLFRTPGSLADRLTEGVVIGYSRDHNDYVFRNHGTDLSVGFAGEGVSASTQPSYGHLIGLQLICNKNTNNDVNLSSRKANGASNIEQELHTIRTSQGNINRPADNEFDEWLGVPMKWDFEMTTTNGIISYWHRSVSPYVPLSYPPMLNPEPVTFFPANNCASKLPPNIPVPPPSVLNAELQVILEQEKLAYGSLRFLYDQLIDGGSTDEVVEEITDAWPQDVWDLRNALLSRSPYLSAEVLMELNEQNKLPALLYTEVCIANPEATKSEGFYYWLENKAPHALPENLLATIAASWEVKTYRNTLESTMAAHHETMSQAANMLMAHISSDTTGVDVNALRAVWQEIRTPAARYAEALTLMEIGEYEAASLVVAAIPQEHTKLKTKDINEKDRMLALIGFMQNLAASGRSDAELTVGEQDQLETLIAGQQDRPAMWMQNVLCFHYGRCASPWTGASGEPKSLPMVKPEDVETPALLGLFPNPATTWAVATLELPAGTMQGTLRILDLSGKQVYTQLLPTEQPQLVLDTRKLAPGAYLVEVSSATGVLATEKLIVQP